MSSVTVPKGLDVDFLRSEIKREYREVAAHPEQGFHFHTGRKLAGILEYDEAWLAAVPEPVLASLAGTGCPFRMGELRPGERVVDLGCGAGTDSFIAAGQVGREGAVVGIDMTEEMLDKARQAAAGAGLSQLEFRQGYLEQLPVAEGWADVVISNGVINLCPDKPQAFAEIYRVLKAGGRMQIADIMVHKPVGDKARQNIDLWTG
jgi:arsenite methyltransferase